MNRYCLRFLLFTLWSIGLALCMPCTSQGSNDPNQLYISLKQIENKFPVPTPEVTVDAGAFYPHGNYETPGKTCFIRPNYNNPRIEANGVNVILRIEIDPPHTQDFKAKVLWIQAGSQYDHRNPLGKKVLNPPTPAPVRPGNPPGKYLYLSLGGRTYPRVFTVCLELSSYDKKMQVEIVIERPLLVGAGAYTIPVIPIAIIYEPPQDKNNKNTATYTQIKSVGTTVRTSVTTENSLTVPVSPQFSDIMGFKSKLNMLSSACTAANSAFANSFTSTAGGILKTFADALGTSSASQTEGTIVTTDHALTIQCAKEDTYPTSLHKGPGLGDRILTRRNARVAWLADNEGGITLYLLPGSIKKAFPVSLLRDELTPMAVLGDKSLPGLASQKIENVQSKVSKTGAAASPAAKPSSPSTAGSGLSRDQVRALLGLDPFVSGGPEADLPAPRFCYEDSYEPTSGSESHVISHTVTKEDLNAKAEYVTKMEDQSPGWLSFLGIGITEEKHVKNSVTHSGSTAVKIGEVVTTKVDFYAEEGETYCVRAYYDRVFGTFAFKRAPLSSEPVLSGEVIDESGQPAAGQLVTLVIGGQKYSTRTDAKGRYALRARDIPAGVGTLTVAGKSRQIALQKQKTLTPERLIVPNRSISPSRR